MKRASFLQSLGFISISPFLTHFEEPSKKTLFLFIGINDLGLIDYLPQATEKVVLVPRLINDLNYKQLVLEPCNIIEYKTKEGKIGYTKIEWYRSPDLTKEIIELITTYNKVIVVAPFNCDYALGLAPAILNYLDANKVDFEAHVHLPFEFEGKNRLEKSIKGQKDISNFPFVNYYQYDKDFSFTGSKIKLNDAYNMIYKRIASCIRI